MELYRSLRIFVFLLLLFNSILAAQIQCSSDADCSNGQGKCIFIASTSYCSCLSGFGGNDCSERPDPSCTFGIPTSFQTDSSLELSNENLTLSIAANLEHSKKTLDGSQKQRGTPYSEELTITFGNGTHRDCNYPSSNNLDWRDHSSTRGDCKDRYSLSLRVADAKSKCGFSDKKGNRVFEQIVHVNRNYHLENDEGHRVTKTETSVKKFTLTYPKTIKHTSVARSTTPNLLSAITVVDFDPSSEKWTVEATTSVEAPFKLINPVVVDTNGAIATSSRFIQSSESLSVVYGCTNNTEDCFQKIVLQFDEGSALNACEGLNGDVTVRMNLTCSEGSSSSGCNLEGGETVQTVLSLATSSACPITEQISFSATSMSSFSTDSLSSSRTSFISNQIGYFGVRVESNDALISGRHLKPNSVCFQIDNQPCQAVQYSVMPSSGSNNPVFSVDFSNPNNSNVFGFLNSSGSSQLFSVHAVIEVDFSDVDPSFKQAITHSGGLQETQIMLTTTVKLIPPYLDSPAVLQAPSILLLSALLIAVLFL